MKNLIIISLCLATTLAGCSSNHKTSHSSSENTSSSLTIHSSNMAKSTQTGNSAYDAAFSYSCAGGVSGNSTLSAATISLGTPSSCAFTFNSVTYNGTTASCDTSTVVNSSNPANITPVLISCSSYTLKIVTLGIFDTKTESASLYTTLLSSPTSSATSAHTFTTPIIGTGDQYSCGLTYSVSANTTTPKLYCWGNNPNIFFYYTYPSGVKTFNYTTYASPTEISTTFTPKDLAVGDEIVCAIDTDNQVWCLGHIAAQATSSFTQITISGTPQKIVAGAQSACVLTKESTNTLQCFGYVDFASPAASGGFVSSPVTIPASGTFSGAISQFVISSDLNFGVYGALCAVVASDSHVECVGNNVYGQLGIGVESDTDYHTPSPVLKAANTSITGVTQISGKNGTFCVVDTTDSVYCWGAANNTPNSQFIGQNYERSIVLPYSNTPPTDPNYPYIQAYEDYYSNIYSVNYVAEPNFFGFMSYDSWSASGWPGGGYVFANVPTSSNDFTSTLTGPYAYYDTFNYATLLPGVTLNTISVGGQAICGTYDTTLYCYGVDLTSTGPTASSPYFGEYPLQANQTTIWSGHSVINEVPIYFNSGMGIGFWTQFAYGGLGTLTASLSEPTNDPGGMPGNGITSYTANTSTTGGGIFTLPQTLSAISVGSAYALCITSISGVHTIGHYANPGHACVVTIDGAISCFGANDCGQVGNGTIYKGSSHPSNISTSPTTVLYPSSSSYSGGVGY